jgi:transposase
MNTTPPKNELLDVINTKANIREVASHYNVGWSTIRCWLRWTGINLKPPMKSLLADCGRWTDKEIAAKYKVSDRTIVKWKNEYGISKKNIRNDSLPKSLTDEQKNIVVGKLLGDGHVQKIRRKNTCLSVEHSLAQEEYVYGVHNILQPLGLSIRYRSRKNPFKTMSHHADMLHSCLFNTVSCPIFTDLRHQWYKDGIKTVPENIDLTWQTIAIWYCDDGSNLLGERCIRRHGALCTNSFSPTSVEFLIEKLREKSVTSHLYFDNGLPMIHINKESFMYFLDCVKQYIPWKCFDYKLMRNKTQSKGEYDECKESC